MKDKPGRWQNRAHFCDCRALDAAKLDRARGRAVRRSAEDNGRVTLDEGLMPGGERSIDLIALDEALERLAALDADQARLVELRFFGNGRRDR
jgi:hypothetical protein